MAPPCTLSFFADDAQSTYTSVKDLLAMAPALEVADAYMDLKAQFGKCRILPIGAKRADFAALLAAESSHVLRLCQASDTLRDVVESTQELLASMPRAWFKPFSHHAQGLFGLPMRYLSVDALQMLLQIKSVHGLGPE
eukprot:364967-Amphidinium_carterae.1